MVEPHSNARANASSSREKTSLFDVRKIVVAAIAVWTVHAWALTLSERGGPPSRAPTVPAPRWGPPRPSTTADASSLGRAQSDGFFDDVPDWHWRMLQEHHAALFPNYYANLRKYSHGPGDKGNIPQLRNSHMWYGQNFQTEFVCPLARRLPPDSMADGPKWVCNPHRIARQKECLVYSVGSNGKVEFEKAIREEIGSHCEIHTFDMVRYNRRNGDFEQALRPYATFHNWGLGTAQEARNNPRQFKTIQQTMEELGHAGKTIDIFKIDCEWCEWFTWSDWLDVDMRQILVETHNAPMPNARDFFFALHDRGFLIFSKEANYENGAGGVEYGFVKVSPQFFLNDTLYYKTKSLPGE